jgi:hypothetical protein
MNPTNEVLNEAAVAENKRCHAEIERLTAALAAAEAESHHLAERLIHHGDVLWAVMKERDAARAALATAEERANRLHEAKETFFHNAEAWETRAHTAEDALVASIERLAILEQQVDHMWKRS